MTVAINEELDSLLPPISPGTALGDELRLKHLSQAEAAEMIGISRQYMSDLIRDARTIGTRTAVRLERAGLQTAEYWMSVQSRWDLWHERHQKAS